MDVIQTIASAADLVRSMVQAIQSLQQASRDAKDAPRKVENLENMLNQLTELYIAACNRYSNRLHHTKLDLQLKSLDMLLQTIRPQVKTARRIANRKGIKSFVRIVRSSVVGDDLTNISSSIMLHLDSWLQQQIIASDLMELVDSTARNLPSLLRVQSESNYPLSQKATFIKEVLASSNQHRVVLIHGLSGIGKSCLARQVAADPPKCFSDGAVELVFGQWCSRTACNGNPDEYRKRLAVKIGRLLRKMGQKRGNLDGASFEDVCYMLQETLESKRLLVLLDDVWEPDIIDRFVALYDNGCKYLVTTRNEAVYEITGAVNVEIGKDETRFMSKAIVLFHSQLSEFELPSTAEVLIQRCGHHPLTLAVMGKALRGETRPDQWEKAVENLWTYAAQAPVPVPYLNEKEAQTAATVFGSFEYSLEGMSTYARDYFTVLAALNWDEPIPETCLEAMWSALGQDSTFLLVTGKLIERSLLSRADKDILYEVHDMVTLYLQRKVPEALWLLLQASAQVNRIIVAPWLVAFGNIHAQEAARQVVLDVLCSKQETLICLTLSTIVDVLLASKSISELEATSISFYLLAGPQVSHLISLQSEELAAALVRYLASCFTANNYMEHSRSLVSAGLIEKSADLLKRDVSIAIKIDAVMVLTRLMELKDASLREEVVNKAPIRELITLMDPAIEETQDTVITALLTLAKAGREEAILQMFNAGMGEKLSVLLNGNEITQSRAVATLKSFHELGGSRIVNKFVRSIIGNLKLMPWQIRLVLERLIKLERIPSMPTQFQVDQLAICLNDGSYNEQFEALQDLVTIVEKADNPNIRQLICNAKIIESLAKRLCDESSESRLRSEAAFALMKLGCSGGGHFIRSILKAKVVENLVIMMCKSSKELQDTAYSSLHNLMGAGKILITDQILASGQLEKIVSLLQYKSIDSKEMGVNCIQDLVDFGGKTCIEHLLALQIIEKLAIISKNNNRLKDAVINFVRAVECCQGLSGAERRVFRQQLTRKVKASVKDKNQVTAIVSILQGSSEGSSRGSHGSTSQGASSRGSVF